MIHEIQAKTILAPVQQPDTWFGLRYNMNLYRGCQHRCIYCDSRSQCYGIDHFDRDILVKVNAIDLLRRELAGKRIKGTIGTGAMHDPYMPVEARYNLTRQALAVIAEWGFPVHVITKSNRVLRDIESLKTINRVLAVVSFTLTTVDDTLARQIEPGAPPPSARLAAMAALAAQGIPTGVVLMPVLPFIEDYPAHVTAIVEAAQAHGASYVIPSFGVTLRDRQRVYFYAQLDRLFPGLRARYVQQFGGQYFCPADDIAGLKAHFNALCDNWHLPTQAPAYRPAPQPQQMLLF